MPAMLTLPFRSALLGVTAAVLLAGTVGCDSSDPVDPPSPEDVEGIYDFTEFSFDPNAGGIADANVLDTLVAANTFVELFGSGEADLRYKFENAPSDRISGTFTVTAAELRLTFANAEDRLASLLLSNTIPFERDGDGVLLFEGERTVDLEAFDPVEYEDLNAVGGTLTIRLVRRTE